MGLSLQILLHLKVDVCESLEAVAANQGSGATPKTSAELWHLLKFGRCGEKHTSSGFVAASHAGCPRVSQMTQVVLANELNSQTPWQPSRTEKIT